MAATALSTNGLNQTAGTAPSFVAANVDGNFVSYARTGFLVVKTSGTSCDVTVVVPGNLSYGAAAPDITISLTATDEKWIPLGNALFREPTTGKVNVTYSAVTGVTVAYVSV